MTENISASFRELAEWLKELVPSEKKTTSKKYGIGKSDFNTIKFPQMPIKGDYKDLSEKKGNEKERSYRQLNKKRMLDEAEIIARLRNFISETISVNIKASDNDHKTIFNTLISDVKDHLFECKAQCPFCLAPCNETHSSIGTNIKHFCNGHRPQGFSTYIDSKSKSFCHRIM